MSVVHRVFQHIRASLDGRLVLGHEIFVESPTIEKQADQHIHVTDYDGQLSGSLFPREETVKGSGSLDAHVPNQHIEPVDEFRKHAGGRFFVPGLEQAESLDAVCGLLNQLRILCGP